MLFLRKLLWPAEGRSRLHGRHRLRFGPLVEAFLWTFGFLMAQSIILVLLLALILVSAFGLTWPPQDEILTWVLEADLDRSFLLVGVPVLGALFLIIPAIRFREGKEFRQRIGWRTPTSDEVVYSLAMVVPVALIGNLVYDVMNQWWQGERFVWPFAMAVHENSLDHLYRTFQGVPYPALVVALALAPAVVEELVFRGMLGRKLVQQFGVFWGVGISSCLFAMVHGSPPHAIATLPIAVLLHTLYLRTGTIWVPVLVHFCNNLLAISMVHFRLGADIPLSATFMATLCGYLGLMLFLLHIRCRRETVDLVNSLPAADGSAGMLLSLRQSR